MHRCMTARKKDDSQCRNQEVIEAHLLGAVYISGLVEMSECTDRIPCQLNDDTRIMQVLLDRISTIENGSIN